MDRLPRYRTGDSDLDAQVAALVDASGATENRDQIFELVATALRFSRDRADRGDMKMANAALKEMRYAFRVFAPYRASRKAAIFGSARTDVEDPLYEQTVRFARTLAERDWMVISGAGPGIMEAAIEGAGSDHAFGVSIRLPFESSASSYLSGDPKLVNFRYFFTRKVSFIKEADGFALLPGGFGTLDELFELLTLMQTGKAQPGPIVLLDVPGGTYWREWWAFIQRELAGRNYISDADHHLVTITDDVEVAVGRLLGFFANYHSLRFVGRRLVLRMRTAPDAPTRERLSRDFADVIERGVIERVEAAPVEIADDDRVDLERVAFHFDRHGWSRLVALIDELNRIPTGTARPRGGR